MFVIGREYVGGMTVSEKKKSDVSNAKDWDLTNGNGSDGEGFALPGYDLICEKFARVFGVSLGKMLSSPLKIEASKTKRLPFGEYSKAIARPCCLSVIRLEELKGSGWLNIDTSLLWGFVELLLGGGAKLDSSNFDKSKELTTFDLKIARKVSIAALDDFTKAWEQLHPAGFKYVRGESNPDFVVMFPPTELVCVTEFSLEAEGFSGRFQMMIPFKSLATLQEKLSATYICEDVA